MAPFKCIRCGKCCLNTEMPLTEEDIARLEALGYIRRDFARVEEGLIKLRNVDGHCFFYNPELKACMVYENRPEGCRLYPFIYVEGVGVTVDPECSVAHTVSGREVAKAAPKVLSLLRRLGLLKEG
ncbi:MAG: YkgJ family cysteine cluster protein [Thermoprotei archaeon]|nr:MAG: YkgJ family cysteine cluster protein [Thermoprotei archaeon]